MLDTWTLLLLGCIFITFSVLFSISDKQDINSN